MGSNTARSLPGAAVAPLQAIVSSVPIERWTRRHGRDVGPVRGEERERVAPAEAKLAALNARKVNDLPIHSPDNTLAAPRYGPRSLPSPGELPFGNSRRGIRTFRNSRLCMAGCRYEIPWLSGDDNGAL